MMANTTANLTLIQPTLTSLISVAKPTNQGQVIVNNSSSGFTTSTFISGITGPNGSVSGAVTLQGSGITQSGNTFTFTGGGGGGISNLIINGNGAAPTTSSTIDFQAGSGISLSLNNSSSPNTITISSTGTSGVGQISVNGTNPITGNLNFTTPGNGLSLTSNGSNSVSFTNTGIVIIQSGGSPVIPVNGIVNFQAGNNVSLTPSGNAITISANVPASLSTTIQGASMKGSGGIATSLTFNSGSLSATISCYDLRSNTILNWLFNSTNSYLSTDSIQVSGIMTILGCSALTGSITNTGDYSLYAIGPNTTSLIDSGTFSFPLSSGQSTSYTIQTNKVKVNMATSQFILQISNTSGPSSNGQVGLTQVSLLDTKF